MKKIDRLVLGEMLMPWLFGVFLFTVLISAGQFLFQITEYLARGADVWATVKLLGLLMPGVMAKTFSMAVLLSALLSFGRLSGDSEIVAMRAGGISVARIMLPVGVFGLIVFGIAMSFNEYFVPRSTLQAIQLRIQIDAELERLTERIVGLLDAGWKTVRVVTDHGWLLLPGGLPTVKLPRHLTETRWARCAVIAGESTPEVMRTAWHWNETEYFATPPGIACFSRSEWYAHGGLSVQECLIPDIHVERASERSAAAAIDSITWRGLRCFVEATTKGGRVTADLRLERPTGLSVVAAAKLVEEDGAVSLVLADDSHEEARLVLVLVDDAGDILSQRPTRVGDDV